MRFKSKEVKLECKDCGCGIAIVDGEDNDFYACCSDCGELLSNFDVLDFIETEYASYCSYVKDSYE